MKKKLVLITTVTMLLSACGTQENAEEAAEENYDELPEINLDDSDQGEDQQTDSDLNDHQIHDQEVEHAQPATDISEYEELDRVKEYFNPDDYEVRVANDTPGNRVLLFMEGDKPSYKTVYIKSEEIVKVISTDEGLVYEGRI